MTSWRRMTSRFRHGLGTAGPPRPLQADTPVTWVTKVINAVGYRTSNGRFPKRENRSLVLRSAAEENGVSMLRKGGHRPRDARAFLSVCGLTVTSQKATTKEHTTHTKERTPVVHLTLAYLTHSDRVTEVARGANARPGRSPKTNSHPPHPVCFSVFLYGPRGHRESFSSGAGRAARGDVVVSHDVTTCHGGMTTQQVLSEGGDGPR